MQIRSDPLGPPSDAYPVSEYVRPRAGGDEDAVDAIRIEKLALKPISASLDAECKDKNKPMMYDAAVQFAIDGRSWPLRLSFDVSFVSAYPCANGPHVLFHDYIYQAVGVDEILTIRDWGCVNAGNGNGNGSGSLGGQESNTGEKEKEKMSNSKSSGVGSEEDHDNDEREKVLVVPASGVSDNEVLVRAWCSHWGLGAVVADLRRTWWVLCFCFLLSFLLSFLSVLLLSLFSGH